MILKKESKKNLMDNLKQVEIPGLKTYGYVRVSTEEQAMEGISLEAQREKIKAFVTLHDLNLLQIISDEGASGKDLNRPGLKKLLTLLQGKEADAIVVYKLDRLTRRTRDLLYLIEDVFKKGNTRFFSISEQIDTETALGKFFLTLMGALAQMERELISERTKTALELKKQKGERLGTTPLGYITLPDGTLTPDKTELKIIKLILQLHKESKPYNKIARILNQEGVRTKRGTKFYASTIKYICESNRYQNLPKLKIKK